MSTIASALLDFLLSLLRDPEAARAFHADPEKALQDAGLGGVCTDDVDAVLPVVFDYAPVRVDSTFDRDYSTGGNTAAVGYPPGDDGPGAGPGRDDDRRDDDGRAYDDDHGHAVQQLTHIVNNYSYTSRVDDRDSIVDQSVNQNIWAQGDVTQLFDNDAVLASGDHAVAAGGTVVVDRSTDESTTVWADDSTVGIGTDDHSVDESVTYTAGDDVEVGNDSSVSDSFDHNAVGNQDNDVTVRDNVVGNEDNDVVVRDNAVGNQDNDVVVRDNVVGNEDNDVTEDNDVVVRDNAVGNQDNDVRSEVTTDLDVDSSVTDSYNPELTFTDESVSDSVIVEDVEVEVASHNDLDVEA